MKARQYDWDSQFFRNSVRAEQEHDAQLAALRSALIEGESSGVPQAFDAWEFKRRMATMHG